MPTEQDFTKSLKEVFQFESVVFRKSENNNGEQSFHYTVNGKPLSFVGSQDDGYNAIVKTKDGFRSIAKLTFNEGEAGPKYDFNKNNLSNKKDFEGESAALQSNGITPKDNLEKSLRNHFEFKDIEYSGSRKEKNGTTSYDFEVEGKPLSFVEEENGVHSAIVRVDGNYKIIGGASATIAANQYFYEDHWTLKNLNQFKDSLGQKHVEPSFNKNSKEVSVVKDSNGKITHVVVPGMGALSTDIRERGTVDKPTFLEYMVATYEGYADKIYKCSADVPTIGFGDTHDLSKIKGVEDAFGKLQKAIEDHIENTENALGGAKALDRMPPLVQNQAVSFAFNLGQPLASYKDALKSQDYDRANDRIVLFNKASGKYSGGLAHRRSNEVLLSREETLQKWHEDTVQWKGDFYQKIIKEFEKQCPEGKIASTETKEPITSNKGDRLQTAQEAFPDMQISKVDDKGNIYQKGSGTAVGTFTSDTKIWTKEGVIRVDNKTSSIEDSQILQNASEIIKGLDIKLTEERPGIKESAQEIAKNSGLKLAEDASKAGDMDLQLQQIENLAGQSTENAIG